MNEKDKPEVKCLEPPTKPDGWIDPWFGADVSNVSDSFSEPIKQPSGNHQVDFNLYRTLEPSE